MDSSTSVFPQVQVQFEGSSVHFGFNDFDKHFMFNANSLDPDQMQRTVVSDLGLHCLYMSFW